MPVINKDDFSAFDEALKKAPSEKTSSDDFSAFDKELKKKEVGQKPGTSPTESASPSKGKTQEEVQKDLESKFPFLTEKIKTNQPGDIMTGQQRQQMAVQKTISDKEEKYKTEVLPKKAKAEKEKAIENSLKPEVGEQFNPIDFATNDISTYSGGASLNLDPNTPSKDKFKQLNLFFGNDASNVAPYFKNRIDAVDKQIKEIQQNAPLWRNLNQGKSDIEEIEKLRDYKLKLGAASNKLATDYTAWLYPELSTEDKGYTKRKLAGDETVNEEIAFKEKGIPLTDEQKYNNERQGLDVERARLENDFVGIPPENRSEDYFVRLTQLNDSESRLINKYPDYKRNQVGMMIAQLAAEDPEIDAASSMGITGMKMLDYSEDLSQKTKDYLTSKYKIPAEDLKFITYGDIPNETISGNLRKGVFDTGTSIGTGALRIMGNLLGVDNDRLSYLGRKISGLGSQLYGDNPYEKTSHPQSIIDINASSPTYLQNIPNPNANKSNYNINTVSNAMAEGASSFAGFMLGIGAATKGVQAAEWALMKPLTVAAEQSAAMTAYMVISNYNNNYEKANEVLGKDATDASKGFLATAYGYIDKLAFDVLPKDKLFMSSQAKDILAKEMSPLIKDFTIKNINRAALQTKVQKAIEGIVNTSKEVGAITTAMSAAEISKGIVNSVVGTGKPKEYMEDAWQGVKHHLVETPLTMALPLGLMEVVKMKAHNDFFKENSFNAGLEPNKYISIIQQESAKGNITKEEAQSRIELVKVMHNIVQSIPDTNPKTGERFTHKEQVDYANNRLRESALRAKALELAEDPAIASVYLEDAQKLADERKVMLEAKAKTEAPITITETKVEDSKQKEGVEQKVGEVTPEEVVEIGAKPKPNTEQGISDSNKWINDLFDNKDGTRIKDNNGNTYEIKNGKLRKLTFDENGEIIDSEIVYQDNRIYKRGTFANPDFFNDGYKIMSEKEVPKTKLPQQKTVEQLRAEEQAELDSRIPNAEQYRVDGKVDRDKLTNPEDIKAFDEVYNKYDKLIEPLLKEAEITKEGESKTPEQKEEKLSPEEADIEKRRQNELRNFDENITNKGRLISDAGEVETFMNADGEWSVSTSLPKDKNKPWERTKSEALSGEFKTKEEALEFAKSVIDKLKEKTNAKYDAEKKALKEGEPKVEVPKQKKKQPKGKAAKFVAEHIEEPTSDGEGTPKPTEEGEPIGAVPTQEHTVETIDKADTTGFNEVQKKNISDIKRVLQAITKFVGKDIGKKLKVVIHSTRESAAKAAYDSTIKAGGTEAEARANMQNQGNRGWWTSADGEIHLNMAEVSSETGFHEGTHPILDAIAKVKPEAIDQFHKQLEVLPQGKEIIDLAKDNYAEYDSNGNITNSQTVKNEAITDYIAKVADGQIKIDKSNFEKVKNYVVNLLTKLGIMPEVDIRSIDDLRKLAQTISEKFAKGEEIKDVSEIKPNQKFEPIKNNGESGEVNAAGKIDPKNVSDAKVGNTNPLFSKETFKEVELVDLPIKSLKEKLDEFDNKAIAINSDPTRVGKLEMPSGKEIFLYGGARYSSIKENVNGEIGFSSTNLGKPKQVRGAVDKLFPEKNGEGLVFVATQSPESMKGNAYSLEYILDALSMLPKTILKSSDFKNEFFGKDIVAIKNEFGENKYNEFLKKYGRADFSNPEIFQQMTDNLLSNVGANFMARNTLIDNMLAGIVAKNTRAATKGEPGYVSVDPKKYIAKQLLYRLGLNQEKLFYEIGEKGIVDAYMNEGKWGFITNGFTSDSKIDHLSIQEKGVIHPQFNAKFHGKDPFFLDGAYMIDKLFLPEEIVTKKGGIYVKKASIMVAGSMYPKGKVELAEREIKEPFTEIPQQKTKTNDTENITGLPSKIGGGKESITAKSKQGAGTEKTGAGGVLQAPGAEGKREKPVQFSKKKEEVKGTLDGKPVTFVKQPENVEVVNGFYSPVEKRLVETKIEKQSANKWREVVGKGDEAKFTGVLDWLESLPPTQQVSKSEIQNWMKDNRIEINEVVKGGENKEYNDLSTKITDTEEKAHELANESGTFDEELYNDYLKKNNYFSDVEKWKKLRDEEAIKKSTSPVKYEDYQLPGEKTNYKEVLVTLPVKVEYPKQDYTIKSREEYVQDKSNYKVEEKDDYFVVTGKRGERSQIMKDSFVKTKEQAIDDYINQNMSYQTGDMFDFYDSEGNYFNTAFANSKKEAEQKYLEQNKKTAPAFKSSHYDEPNILAHIRMNTRVDAEGNKVLHIEEFQSDFGQKAKKEGFILPEKEKNNLKNEQEKIKERRIAIIDEIQDAFNKEDYDKVKSLNEEDSKLNERTNEIGDLLYKKGGVPEAPFVSKTSDWTKLAWKVALKEAVKEGADKITWTTGEQQNERYDLSKQVDEIGWQKNEDGTYNITPKKSGTVIGQRENMSKITLNRVADLVGKDIAEKIKKEEGKEWQGGNVIQGTLKGEQLTVGGTGMKGFYGSPSEGKLGIVGEVAKSLFKQEPKTTELVKDKNPIGSDTVYVKENEFKDWENDGYVIDKDNPTKSGSYKAVKQGKDIVTTQQSIDITPEMKAQVEYGMPMFSKSRDKKMSDMKDILKEYVDEGKSLDEIKESMKEEFGDYYKDVEGIIEQAHQEMTTTGIKNKVTERERAERGLAEVEVEAKRSFGKVFDDAKNMVANGEANGLTLAAEIVKNPRPLKAEESAILLIDRMRISNEYNKKNAELLEAQEKGETDKADIIQSQMEALEEEMDLNDEAAIKSGYEQGLGLAARRMLIAQDYSLVTQMNRLKAANGGKEVPKQYQEQLKSLITQLEEANNKLEKLEKTQAGTEKQKEVSKVKPVSKTPEQVAKEKENIKSKIISKWGQTLSRMKSATNIKRAVSPTPVTPQKQAQLESIVKDVNDMVKLYAESGVTDLKKIIDNVHQDLVGSMPGLDRVDIEDVVLGRYDVQKPKTSLTPAKIQAQANVRKVKNQIDLLKEELKNKQRGGVEKAVDYLHGWHRAAILSGVPSAAKISTAALTRGIVTRGENIVGQALSLIPGIRKVAKLAPREGGFNRSAEAKAFTTWFDKMTRQDISQVMKTGISDIDYMYGMKEPKAPKVPEWMEFFGRMHSAIKLLPKRAEFFRSLEMRTEQAIKEGKNPNDAVVQQELGVAAYNDALRSIFMQENILTENYQAAIRKYEQTQPTTASILKFLFPIVKVPSNYVAEQSSYVPVVAAIKAITALYKGRKGMTPEQADFFMRALKKGSIGTAFIALGFFNPGNFGGYYTGKRKEDELEAGDIELYGVKVPHFMTHTPLLEMLQIGATLRRAQDAKLAKGEAPTKFDGVPTVLKGQLTQIPFIGTGERLTKLLGNKSIDGVNEFANSMVQSVAEPQLMQNIADWTDIKDGENIKRETKGLGEKMKEGIPGLRQSLKEKDRAKFTDKEYEEFSNITEKGLSIPELNKRTTYKVKIDEKHPDGHMTEEEYEKFIPLQKQYAKENYKSFYRSNKYDLDKLEKMIKSVPETPKEISEFNKLKEKIQNKIESEHKDAIQSAKKKIGFR
jgi:hypothetical protein